MHTSGTSLRRDTRGGINQLETAVMAGMAVTIGVLGVSPFGQVVTGRFVEVDEAGRIPVATATASNVPSDVWARRLGSIPGAENDERDSEEASEVTEAEESEAEGDGWWSMLAGWLPHVSLPRSEGAAARIIERLALAASVVMPLDLVRAIAAKYGVSPEKLAEVEDFRSDMQTVAVVTAETLFPALARLATDAANEAMNNPEKVIAALTSPSALWEGAKGFVAANFEHVDDWATYFTTDDPEEAKLRAERLVSGMVVGQILRVGGGGARNNGRAAVKALNVRNSVERRAWDAFTKRAVGFGRRAADRPPYSGVRVSDLRSNKFQWASYVQKEQRGKASLMVHWDESIRNVPGRGQVIDRRITGAMQVRRGRNSLGVELLDDFGDREGVAMLRAAVRRSRELGYEGRIRVVPTETTRPFLAKHGLVPMLQEVPESTDYVLSRRSAAALLNEPKAVRDGLGEWTKLPEWETTRLRTFGLDASAERGLYRDIQSLMKGGEHHNNPFEIELAPGHQGRMIFPDRRRVVLDADMDPDVRLLALAHEVGEIRAAGRFADASDPLVVNTTQFSRPEFVRWATTERIDAVGAPIMYELDQRAAISERIRRQIPSRYSDPEYLRIYNTLRHQVPQATEPAAQDMTEEAMKRAQKEAARNADQAAQNTQRRLGIHWARTNRTPDRDQTYFQAWTAHYKNVWDEADRQAPIARALQIERTEAAAAESQRRRMRQLTIDAEIQMSFERQQRLAREVAERSEREAEGLRRMHGLDDETPGDPPSGSAPSGGPPSGRPPSGGTPSGGAPSGGTPSGGRSQDRRGQGGESSQGTASSRRPSSGAPESTEPLPSHTLPPSNRGSSRSTPSKGGGSRPRQHHDHAAVDFVEGHLLVGSQGGAAAAEEAERFINESRHRASGRLRARQRQRE